MRRIGAAIIIVGLLVIWRALQMPTSLNEQAAHILGMASVSGSDIANISLLQQQKMVFDAGLAAIIVGAMTIATGYVAAITRKQPD